MTISIMDGDLLKARENIIGHQVNCKGVMGSGIAKQIKNKYPRVFLDYNRLCKDSKPSMLKSFIFPDDPSKLLGTCQILPCEDGKYVANIFGQDDFGVDKCCTNYEALRNSLQDLCSFAKKNNFSVALPFNLGCYRGGGDWNTVVVMLDNIFDDSGVDITLYRFEQ